MPPGDRAAAAQMPRSVGRRKGPGRRLSTNYAPASGSPGGERNGASLAATINAFQLHKVEGKKKTGVGQDQRNWNAWALLVRM